MTVLRESVWFSRVYRQSVPALLAQLVEHFHGKEGVIGSSPIEGSIDIRFRGRRDGDHPQMPGFCLSGVDPGRVSPPRGVPAPRSPRRRRD